MSTVAVIVVNYGSSGLLSTNLSALAAELPSAAIVVVDCFTNDAERQQVATLADSKGWRRVLLDENLGFGGGINRGAAAAIADGADILLILNPDAVLSGASAQLLVDEVAADPLVLAAPVIHRPDGSIWTAGMDVHLDDGSLAGWRFRERNGDRPRRSWISGACFAVSAEMWHKTEGFDEDYFLYWEDVDLSHRILNAGGRLVVLPEATAIHDEGGTQQALQPGRARSEIFYYYNIRNRLLYAARTLDAATESAWRRSALRTGIGTLRGAGRRQLVTSIAPWRALWRGLRDGRRGKVGP